MRYVLLVLLTIHFCVLYPQLARQIDYCVTTYARKAVQITTQILSSQSAQEAASKLAQTGFDLEKFFDFKKKKNNKCDEYEDCEEYQDLDEDSNF